MGHDIAKDAAKVLPNMRMQPVIQAAKVEGKENSQI